MSECACSFTDGFLPTTNKGMVKIGYFSSNCPNYTVNVRVSLVSQYHLLVQYDLSINKSNQLAVIVFHQSATGDTRENLDFAVDRQNCA